MVEAEFHLTPEDYVRAQYLHMRPRRWVVWIGVGLLVVFIVTAAFDLVSIIRGDSSPGPLLIVLALMAFFGLQVGWFVPRRARKLWNQQKGLHVPIRMRISEEGVLAQSVHGQSLAPWDHVHRWRESRWLFLLYLADSLFKMVPKRDLSAEQLAELRRLLNSRSKSA